MGNPLPFFTFVTVRSGGTYGSMNSTLATPDPELNGGKQKTYTSRPCALDGRRVEEISE